MTRDGDAQEKGKGKGKDERPDSELSEDELAKRRAARASNGNGSASISQRARDGEEPEPSGEELFPLGTLSGDPKRTVRNLIKAGAKVKTSVSMTRAAVPNPDGGLFDPEEEVEVLVRVLPGEAKQTPVHEDTADGRHKVKEWHISQELRVIHVAHASAMYHEEQVVEMMEAAGVPAAKIAKLLGHEGTGTEG